MDNFKQDISPIYTLKREKNTQLHYLSSSAQFSSVQSLSRVRLFATPWIAARQAALSITNSRSSLRLTSIETVMPSSHLILCCPLFHCPQSLPASESFPMSQLFTWGGQSTGVLALASYHSFQRNPRADLLQNGLAGSPCSSRDSQESSPTPQFFSLRCWWAVWGYKFYY